MSSPKLEADSTTSRTTQSPSAPSRTAQSLPLATPEISRRQSVPSQPPVAEADSSRELAASTAPKIDPAGSKAHAETSSPEHQSVEIHSVSRPSGSQNTKEELLGRQERARALFEKYDVPFEASPWDVHPKLRIERVHKTPRIRVRWTCHECRTTFGHDATCVECAHHRCRSCVRNPPKRNKTKVAKAAALAADRSNPPDDEGQDGCCHECQANFQAGSQECSNCHHRICDRCLQQLLPSDRRVQTPAI